MYHPFSVPETLKTSWHIFKNNAVTIIVYSVISFILVAIMAIILGLIFSSDAFWPTMLVSFILIFVQAYTTLGLYKLIFTVIDSEYYEFELKQVLPGAKMVFSYLIVIFILAFLTTNSRILIERLEYNPTFQFIAETIIILIALYFALRIMFFNNFIVDDKSGPIESLRQSFTLTKGYLLKVVLILLIILLLIAVPAMASEVFPLISLVIIITYPFVNIVLAVTYRKLVYSHQDVDDDIAETL